LEYVQKPFVFKDEMDKQFCFRSLQEADSRMHEALWDLFPFIIGIGLGTLKKDQVLKFDQSSSGFRGEEGIDPKFCGIWPFQQLWPHSAG